MRLHKQEAIRLREGQLRPADNGCSICGQPERVRTFQLQSEPDVWVLKCQSCHVYSASRLPTDEFIGQLYQDYYPEIAASAHAGKVTLDEPNRMAKHIHRRVARLRQLQCVRILDFGGGDGTVSILLARLFLQENSASTAQVVVVDPGSVSPRAADERLLVKRYSTLEEVPGEKRSFHIVLASAVLEHMPYPTPTFRELLGHLAAGAVFYARTPYLIPFMRLLPFRQGTLFSYPYHFHQMGQSFWESILPVLNVQAEFQLMRSMPSLVERSFRRGFLPALASHVMKAPWYILGRWYSLIGGWEVFIRRVENRDRLRGASPTGRAVKVGNCGR